MNDIWLDAIVLSTMCTVGAILMFFLERAVRSMHARRGTTPRWRAEDPDNYRTGVYILILFSAFFIVEAIFKSLK